MSAFLSGSGSALANELTYEVRGVGDRLQTNVINHVEAFVLFGQTLPNGRNNDAIIADAEEKARIALKPFGFYQPTFNSELVSRNGENWTLVLRVDPGPPVVVRDTRISLQGDGADYKPLVSWRNGFPLRAGSVLDQSLWAAQKSRALTLALEQGYRQAQFAEQRIELDLEQNLADLVLVLDTGQRSVMGEIIYKQDILKPSVLANIPRFESGEYYTARLMENFRLDLWKTGYFTDVEVLELSRTEDGSPVVDLEVTTETDHRNTYQGSVGLGSDTGARLQARWSKHPVSSYGDRIDVNAGWQERDNEFSIRGDYRIPRRTGNRQYWVASALYKTELQDFDFKLEADDEDRITLAKGRINDVAFRFGRLQVRNRRNSEDQAFATIFAQFLSETTSRELLPDIDPQFLPLVSDDDLDRRIEGTTNTLALGFEWDQPSIRGKAFDTIGTRDQAHVLLSDGAFGSDEDFFQLYASSRRHYRLGENWKVLLRAEAGFTEAKVDEYSILIDDNPIRLSVTRLPDFYRFRAGGTNSVRGYGFEDLSDNDLGSNNILVASAETEYRFLDRWAAAAFIDIGNAFNDWDRINLRKGWGVGIRWYSIAGSIRVDVAQALDLEGTPWRIHFTIGTPLL